MDWSTASRDLIELIFSCPEKTRTIFVSRLHQYIHAIHPDVLIDSYLSKNNADDNQQIAFYISALLALEENDKISVFQRSFKDLSPAFPDEIHELERFVDVQSNSYLNYIENRKAGIDKLNRYLKRIDGAINNRRYALAIGLANRCLREYYRHFIQHTMNYDLTSIENINQMAMSIYRYITKYFTTHNIPYSATRLLFITIVTNAIFLAMYANPYMMDKALATYARDNVNYIVRFLLRYS